MGWWKPYFFVETNGVQLLFDWAKIESAGTFLLATAAVAALCLLDRFTHHYAIHKLSGKSIYLSTVAWTFQRFTSGLLMLVMMSFNAILFLEVIVFSGLTELCMQLRYQNQELEFEELPQNTIEMC